MASLRDITEELDFYFLAGADYGVLTPEVIAERGAVEIKYGNSETSSRTPLADAEHTLGPEDSNHTCNVCSSRECQGHEGYILFPETESGQRAMIYNSMYFPRIKKLFSIMCMSCCKLALDENSPWVRDRLAEILAKPRGLRLDAMVKMIGANSQKYTHCVHYKKKGGKYYVCPVKKKVTISNKTDLSVEIAPTHVPRASRDEQSASSTRENESLLTELTDDDETSRKRRTTTTSKAVVQEDAQARTIYDIFQYLGGSLDHTADCEYIGLTKDELRGYFQDGMMVIQTMFRPKVSGANNKITQQLTSIINLCTKFKNGVLEKNTKKEDSLVAFLKALQGMVTAYHAMVGGMMGSKKGTQRSGVFGKRGDYTGRTVIAPSLHSTLNEIEIPEVVASLGLIKRIDVTEDNIVMLQELLFAGKIGAVKKLRSRDLMPTRMGNDNFTDTVSHILEVGDIVWRHAQDGDLVVTGRQPIANRHNLFSVRVKVVPGSTTCININSTPGLGADFDGDTMWLFIVQSIEAQQDLEGMLLGKNIRSDQEGRPMVALTYNAVVAATLLTIQQLEIDEEVWSTCTLSYMDHAKNVELESRLAKHRVPRRSGRALFSSTLPPDFHYEGGEGIKKVTIKDGVLVSGMLSSSTVSGSAGGIIDHMSIEYSPDWEVTYNFINNATEMLNEFLVVFGFSVTYTDCLFGQNENVSAMLEQRMERAEDEIMKLRTPHTHYEKIKYEKDVRGIVNGLKSIAKESGVFSVNPREQDFLERMAKYDIGTGEAYETLAAVRIGDDQATSLTIDPTGMDENTLRDLSFMARYVSIDRTKKNPQLEGYIERVLENVAMDPSSATAELVNFKDKLTYVDIYLEKAMVGNNLIMMSKLLSGQKGSEGNLTSIGLELGQQQIMGMRLPQTVTSGTRMLISQRAGSKLPPSRGYIRSSYSRGMTPNESQYLSQDVRQGMAATATTSKIIGETQRRLERSLEPIKADKGCAIFHETAILNFSHGGDSMDGLHLLRVDDSLQCCDMSHMARKINEMFADK
ncbi:DNA-directed RNA polymerase subunit RPB1 [uncultured virus]|nr:DNA-directed RNA polymerase subunit RPB1 [uncultured virus]